jgi:hypothetical protein
MIEVMHTMSETMEGNKCKQTEKCKGRLKQYISGANIHIAAHHKADYGAGK